MLVLPLVFGWVSTEYPWFDQWDVEDRYVNPSGLVSRLPLRLHSHETVITGTAELAAVQKALEHELYTPVTVGGKAVVQVWLNNFTDTDCGPEDTKNPYLETWVNTFVTPKDQPLHLPYNKTIGDMSYIIQDPRSLIWIHRVLCADAPGYPTERSDPAREAIYGGHNIWGFPKHFDKAEITYEYEGNDRVSFEATHLGKAAVKASVVLSEVEQQNVPIPVNIRTADDAVVSGPMRVIQQTRFGEAFNVTQNIAPWNPQTDSIAFGDDAWYGAEVGNWFFEPKLKMHTDDFQIVAWKPSNWLKPKLGAHLLHI